MTAVKLQRERAVVERRRDKQKRRAEGKKTDAPPRTGGEDADIAGIRLGPQPLQDWQRDE